MGYDLYDNGSFILAFPNLEPLANWWNRTTETRLHNAAAHRHDHSALFFSFVSSHRTLTFCKNQSQNGILRTALHVAGIYFQNSSPLSVDYDSLFLHHV
jgi:hypothetical protein